MGLFNIKTISKLLSYALAAATIVTGSGIVSVHADSAPIITEADGWYESAYVKWEPSADADSYNVYYARSEKEDFIKIDDELIRVYQDSFRADVPGLSRGEYVLKIVPIKNGTEQVQLAAVTNALTVESFVREGFAFSDKSPYGNANGSYNADGTLKSGAEVLYITDWNKDYVTIGNDTSRGVGLTEILQIRGKKKEETPLSIRFIGKVTMPANVDNYMLRFENTKNVTIEGVGEDATLHGWGLTFKRACNIEVRNLGIMWYGGVGGDGDSLSLDTENKNYWIHNNDFFYGAPGKDADQVKGDGSIDLKARTDYITISYNHFWDSGKACVSGGVWESKNPDDPEAQIFVTYHHNWFDHSDSRHPRCVAGNTHVYNNYYDGVAKYGIGAAVQSCVFVEGNYFRNCPRPMIIATQGSDCYDAASGKYTDKGTLSGQTGGMIKEYNNYIENANRFYTYQNTPDEGEFDAYHTESREEQVPDTVKAKSGGSTYNNFDTNADVMYTYIAHSPEEARNAVVANAGRLNGGDFKWVFDNDTEDPNSEIIPELQQAIIDYQSELVSVPAIPEGTAPETTTAPGATVKPGETAAPTKPPYAPEGNIIEHNFTTQGLESEFLTFDETSAIKSGKDSFEFNGMTLSKCLEIGSTTEFSFTAPENGKCTFVYSTVKATSAKINGEKVKGDSATGILSFDIVKDTQYTITKADSAYLFYIIIELDNESADATEPPAATEEPDSSYAYEIISAAFNADNKLEVALKCNEASGTNAKLIAAAYSENGSLENIKIFEITGEIISGLDFAKPESGTVKIFVWSDLFGMEPLSKTGIMKMSKGN